MTKEKDAIKFVKIIKDLCKEYGVWRVQTYENKPNLRGIKLELSIKIDPEIGKRSEERKKT